MATLIVTGVGTDIGKTYVTASIIRAVRARGHPVSAFKPVLSGFDYEQPAQSDAGVLLEALGKPVTAETVEAIAPFRYAAPMSPPLAAAREGKSLSFAEVAGACRERMADSGRALLLIEGAGGVMSPLSDGATVLDLIEALAVPVLLVTGAYLGAISHTLTAVEVLRRRGVAIRAVVVNESAELGCSMDEMHESLRVLAGGVPVVSVARGGEVPEELLRLLF
ncbi:MAG TPA: dethiobiotin synthase [Caulobacteraceae bacterium]|nr:dethiobiotin synthase [Caulobacteraceae bacterium]